MGGTSRTARRRLAVGAWLVAVGVVAIGVSVLVGRDEHRTAAAETARIVPRKPLARYNTVVSATGATMARGRDGVTRITLTGVRPQVEMFDVSPGTERTLMPTWVWAKNWRILYRGYEPNTTITWLQRGRRQALTVALASGTYGGDGSITFALRRRAVGTKRALPLSARVYSGRTQRLRDVSVFVDPIAPPGGSPVTIVNQALQTLGEMTVSHRTWTWTPSNHGILSPLPNGEMWASMNVQTGPGGVNGTAINIDYGPAVASGNMPDARLNLISPQPGDGGFFMNLSLPGGQIMLGPQGLDNVLFDTDLSGGTLVLAGSSGAPQGNMLINTDLSNATIRLGQAPGNIVVTPTMSGTTWNGGAGARFGLNGTSFLGVDFSGATLNGIDFSGATIAPMIQQDADGTTTTFTSSFDGMRLGTGVTFGSANYATLLQSVDFSGTGFSGTSFASATLAGCDFSGATFGATGEQGTSFAGATIQGGTFTTASFQHASFAGATLAAVDLSLATFAGGAAGDGGVSFANANIQPGTVFTSGSGIENADFTGAVLDGVVFARGGGAGSSASFVASLLTTIDSTTANGVTINNVRYTKDGTGQVYSVSQGGSMWQPVAVGGAPAFEIVPQGDPVPAPDASQPAQATQEFGS